MFDVAETLGIAFAEIGGRSLAADLYRPLTTSPPPVVVYVHGGGWAAGSRSDNAKSRLAALAAHGVAVLSVDYRLADAAHFPAQLHDVKAAVRWLRAEGQELSVDPRRIGMWGASAGAVLASLAGLTPGIRDLDGEVGHHVGQSTAVQAVVAWFGQSDLLASASRSWLEALVLPFAPEAALLGVEPNDIASVGELARTASPISWVCPDAPPFLIAHGDRDRMVPVSESQLLHDALVRAGGRSSLLLVGGAGHEGPQFDSPESLALTAGFLLGALHDS